MIRAAPLSGDPARPSAEAAAAPRAGLAPLLGAVAFTQAEWLDRLAAVRDEAFRTGWEAGRQEALAAHDHALRSCVEAVAARLGDAADAAAAVAAGTLDGLAAALVEALAVALPSLAGRMAAPEAGHFAAQLLPALAAEPRVEVAVAPDLVDPVRELLAGARQLDVLADAGLAPGDVRLRWRDGEALRRIGEVQRAVLGEIAALAPAAAARLVPADPHPAEQSPGAPHG